MKKEANKRRNPKETRRMRMSMKRKRKKEERKQMLLVFQVMLNLLQTRRTISLCLTTCQ
ncbi:hypothetical protein E2C01_078605 [Portunus trituberculatus]|uniref:Uncharacterized protein n=1 Tax=Portunus trituberculatus TaxID=210409 RepID=A0A5B7IUK3_PORTR|nr:hypothetical protein [Portunus trituberculatus]